MKVKLTIVKYCSKGVGKRSETGELKINDREGYLEFDDGKSTKRLNDFELVEMNNELFICKGSDDFTNTNVLGIMYSNDWMKTFDCYWQMEMMK